ncbi:MAG: sensor histidine kinase [Desulfobacterales bacterium]|nr:MAG: sensor histidine kinase [Desulfobacterales bacterium]
MANLEQLSNSYYRLLTRNIILTIISVSIIPLILVSITIYYQFRTSYHEKVYAHLCELVHKHKQNIDGFLSEKLGDIRFLANSFGLDKLSDESFLQDRLAALQKNYGPVFVDLGIINNEGEQIAYAGPFKLAKANYSDAEWYLQAVRNQYFISDVFLGLRGLPHFIVTVRDTRKGQNWILRATIDFVAFNTLVENIHIGQTGFAFIVNKEGKLQTTPITKPFLDILPGKIIYKDFLNDQTSDPNEIRVSVKPDSKNRKNIYVASFLKNGDWLLVYQQRAADAFADLNKTFKITTILMLLGPLGVVIMAFTLSRMIVNRIARADTEKQLMNEKVVEAGKLASVGELAAGVAHEINNPVAIMVEEAGWMGDLLEEEEFQESKNLAEFKKSIGQIQTQGKRCKQITHKLLSFARRTDGSVQDVDINDMLEELVALSAQRAKYSMVEIQPDYQENLPCLKFSLSELQQVFFNIINNAIDAMEKNGGQLKISSRRKDNYIVVEISDTGTGIPEANLSRIFDPFFTTKPIGKGTGLGLSICYGIIDKMGGKIRCKSSVDVGTTFWVSIPIQAGNGP